VAPLEISSLTRTLVEAGATDVAAGAPGTVEARLPAA